VWCILRDLKQIYENKPLRILEACCGSLDIRLSITAAGYCSEYSGNLKKTGP